VPCHGRQSFKSDRAQVVDEALFEDAPQACHQGGVKGWGQDRLASSKSCCCRATKPRPEIEAMPKGEGGLICYPVLPQYCPVGRTVLKPFKFGVGSVWKPSCQNDLVQLPLQMPLSATPEGPGKPNKAMQGCSSPAVTPCPPLPPPL
jgi:hypothetical protein